MEEITVKISKRLYALTTLTAISLIAVFFTIGGFPDWYALLSVGAFMLLFAYTTWSWFSFTILLGREESLDDRP